MELGSCADSRTPLTAADRQREPLNITGAPSNGKKAEGPQGAPWRASGYPYTPGHQSAYHVAYDDSEALRRQQQWTTRLSACCLLLFFAGLGILYYFRYTAAPYELEGLRVCAVQPSLSRHCRVSQGEECMAYSFPSFFSENLVRLVDASSEKNTFFFRSPMPLAPGGETLTEEGLIRAMKHQAELGGLAFPKEIRLQIYSLVWDGYNSSERLALAKDMPRWCGDFVDQRVDHLYAQIHLGVAAGETARAAAAAAAAAVSLSPVAAASAAAAAAADIGGGVAPRRRAKKHADTSCCGGACGTKKGCNQQLQQQQDTAASTAGDTAENTPQHHSMKMGKNCGGCGGCGGAADQQPRLLQQQQEEQDTFAAEKEGTKKHRRKHLKHDRKHHPPQHQQQQQQKLQKQQQQQHGHAAHQKGKHKHNAEQVDPKDAAAAALVPSAAAGNLGAAAAATSSLSKLTGSSNSSSSSSSGDKALVLLVHCHHGRDRTGLLVGAYKMKHLGFSLADVWKDNRVPQTPNP
ncbi:hypothetical protein ACSSS7_003941 [Eimeria intestinalis]